MKPKRPGSGSAYTHVKPMKPTMVNRLATDASKWLYEVELDGRRAIVLKTAKDVKLLSPNGEQLRFPTIESAVSELRCTDAVLDGVIVALDDFGRSSLRLLHQCITGTAVAPIYLYLFDILNLGGSDLRKSTTDERKSKLSAILARSGSDHYVRLSANLGGSLDRILAAAQELGLEGIVAKRRDAPYVSGARGRRWTKIKLATQQDFVIGGYTEPDRNQRFFGSILVGHYEGADFVFAGRVSLGFTPLALAQLYEIFQHHRRLSSPFVKFPPGGTGAQKNYAEPLAMKRCTWLEPELVCQVRFRKWTLNGELRQPSFEGVRDDKHPRTVIRERWPDEPGQ